MEVNVVPRSERSIRDWTTLVRAEYQESPGLALTLPQVQRLWQFDRETCDAVLQALIESGYLRRTVTGMFVRSEHSV